MKKISFLIFLVLSLFCLAGIAPSTKAAGATLFLSPASGSFSVGKSFTVKVMVNSGGGVGINAAEGAIKYDTSYVTVSSVNKGGSIFSLWTTNNGDGPGYSNTEGKITFGGGSPGAYKGTAGTIFSITFSPKKAGTADVTFTAGIVLAADGLGTNVFAGFGNGKYTLTEAAIKEEVPTKEATKGKGILPPLPEVSSPTHPDESKWYSNSNPEFTWKLLTDLTGVSHAVTDDPTSDPGSQAAGVTESAKFENIKDGLQYFHIKYQNKSGWGQIAHRRFMVDVTPPEPFVITVDSGGDTTNPTPKLRFKTTDQASGIDYFSIIIGSETKKAMPEDVKDGYWQPQPLSPGEYTVAIAAVDKAQNTASSSVTFIVDPLKAPIITSIPKTVSQAEELIIRGTSFYPQVTVKIYLVKSEKEQQEFSVRTDDQGNWSYFYRGKLDKGNYEVWAKLIDDRGAQSLNSSKELVAVVSPSLITKYGWLIILILLIIIVLLVLYIVYREKEFKEEKRRIKRETEEVKDKSRKIFYALREEVDELVELTDKKPGLSENERRVKEKLQESLDIAEEFINKEVADIEKEINLKDKIR